MSDFLRELSPSLVAPAPSTTFLTSGAFEPIGEIPHRHSSFPVARDESRSGPGEAPHRRPVPGELLDERAAREVYQPDLPVEAADRGESSAAGQRRAVQGCPELVMGEHDS